MEHGSFRVMHFQARNIRIFLYDIGNVRRDCITNGKIKHIYISYSVLEENENKPFFFVNQLERIHSIMIVAMLNVYENSCGFL
jgi:hypothetical protein